MGWGAGFFLPPPQREGACFKSSPTAFSVTSGKEMQAASAIIARIDKRKGKKKENYIVLYGRITPFCCVMLQRCQWCEFEYGITCRDRLFYQEESKRMQFSSERAFPEVLHPRGLLKTLKWIANIQLSYIKNIHHYIVYCTFSHIYVFICIHTYPGITVCWSWGPSHRGETLPLSVEYYQVIRIVKCMN